MTGHSSQLSNIGVRQNENACQRLLKARQYRWAVAVRWQITQLILVLAAPILAITFGSALPAAKPYVSFLAVCLTLADVTLVDRGYKSALKNAARASELFDVELLKLDWHSLVAGKPPTPEDSDSAVRGWVKLRTKGNIQDWYALDIDTVSMGLARAICQRTNLTYDSELRGLYRHLLDGIFLVVILVMIVTGMVSHATFADFVLAAWVPAAPFLNWSLRERFRQADAVRANEPVIIEAEKLIEAIIAGACADDDCMARSRALQDAIFHRRATTVLLFPKIYKLRRPNAELRMRAGTAYWIGRQSERLTV